MTTGTGNSAPATWDAFKTFLENEWGAVETWGENELSALFATAGTIVQTFDADAIAFVQSEAQTFLGDIASGKMSLPDAATAVFNSAQSQGIALLEGIATKALMGLIGTFVAGL